MSHEPSLKSNRKENRFNETTGLSCVCLGTSEGEVFVPALHSWPNQIPCKWGGKKRKISSNKPVDSTHSQITHKQGSTSIVEEKGKVVFLLMPSRIVESEYSVYHRAFLTSALHGAIGSAFFNLAALLQRKLAADVLSRLCPRAGLKQSPPRYTPLLLQQGAH